MDTLQLHRIQFSTTLGVHAWEQHQPQKIIANLTLGLPNGLRAFEEDNLEHTVNYAAIVEDLDSWLKDYRCQLLEYLAEQIVKRIFYKFPLIESITLEVFKPAILHNAESVSVNITRQRPPKVD